MKKTLLATLCCGSLFTAFSQNLINNPSFETGTIPTTFDQVAYATDWSRDCGRVYHNVSGGSNPGSPDLFDSRSTNTCYDATNKWGAVAPRTGYRYVGFAGGSFAVNGSYYFAETVKGTLNTALIADCPYTISFYAASIRNTYDCTTSAIDNVLATPNATYNKIEVVLRKDNDCSTGKSVFISGSLNNTTWTQYSGTFTLSAADVAAGYNRIEFRFMAPPNSSVSTGNRITFLEDVSLTQGNNPISSDFTLSASNPAGSPTNYIVTASVASVPAGSGFYWEVSEINPVTNAVIPGTTMTNPSNWWGTALYYTNTFPGYCCNSTVTTGNGTFLLGHKYRVTRGTWGPCATWQSTTKTVYMNIGGKSSGTEGYYIEIEEDPTYNPPMPKDLSLKLTAGLSEGKISNFQVYPNPSHGVFRIQQAVATDEETMMNVYDAFGKLLLTQPYDANETIIDLTEQDAGIYFIQFLTDKHVEMLPIVKE